MNRKGKNMRINDLAFLAIRLLAIDLFIRASSMLPSSISMVLAPAANPQDPAMNSLVAMGSLTAGLALVIFAGILWTISGWLANHMTKGLQNNTETKEELNLQNIYVVGITILGVFIIVSSIPSFISSLGYLLNPGKGEKLEALNAVGPIIEMIIGFMCVFKTESVVAKLRR